MIEEIIDKVYKDIRENRKNTGIIYVNQKTYNDLLDEAEMANIDYNSDNIQRLSNYILAIDIDLQDGEVKVL